MTKKKKWTIRESQIYDLILKRRKESMKERTMQEEALALRAELIRYVWKIDKEMEFAQNLIVDLAPLKEKSEWTVEDGLKFMEAQEMAKIILDKQKGKL